MEKGAHETGKVPGVLKRELTVMDLSTPYFGAVMHGTEVHTVLSIDWLTLSWC
jgi:hypothetical protein